MSLRQATNTLPNFRVKCSPSFLLAYVTPHSTHKVHTLGRYRIGDGLICYLGTERIVYVCMYPKVLSVGYALQCHIIEP